MLLSFAGQSFTYFFLWLTIPPWLTAFIFSFRYIQKRIWEFRIFFLLTFLCNILLFYADNWFTFLTIYESLTLCSLPIIFHDRSKNAISGGKWYFFFSLLSGILILSSVLLRTVQSQWIGIYAYIPFFIAMVGFLIKCGAFPFHVWLPEAHPVAPTPASAVLSGSIIKVGFYGLLFLSYEMELPRIIGQVLLWTAVVTMFYGVIQALLQSNIKKMLAFHSVSQMGYVLLGLSLFWIYREEGALIGSLTHAMNHAYFKSALFIASGIQYLSYHTLDMYQIKQFFIRYKIAAILLLVAVLGISGFPFFNGFVSKTILHEELLAHPNIVYQVVETIFLLTAIGTLVSNSKWFYLSSMRKEPAIKTTFRQKPLLSEWIPLFILGFLIVALGIFPTLYEHFLPYPFQEESHHLLEEILPFHSSFKHSFSGFVYTFFAGIAFLYVGLQNHWFHHHLPSILDIKLWWLVLINQIMFPLFNLIQRGELALIKLYSYGSNRLGGMLLMDTFLEKKIAFFYHLCYINPVRFCQTSSSFEARFQENLFISINPPVKDKNKNPAAEWFVGSENSLLTGFRNFYNGIKCLFSISHTIDNKDSQYYDKILTLYGKIWIRWLIGITVLLILVFILIVRKYIP